MADSVATIALGVISSKNRNFGNNNPKVHNELTAFWAPFMLLHLGGQDTITAFAIQDNQLWLRHFLALVVQSCVTFYIFNTSLKGNWLSLLTIPMILVGFIRYVERIWVMRSANKPPVDADEIPPVDAGISNGGTTTDPLITFGKFRDLFLYQKMPVAFRQGIRGQFESYDFRRAFERIEIELGHAYDYFYTKAPLFYRSWGCIFRSITRCFIFCVFVFFIVKERQRDLKVDLIITYILLGGALFIETYTVILHISSNKGLQCPWLEKLNPFFSLFVSNDKLWSNTMGQFNMLSFCSKNPGIDLHGTPKFFVDLRVLFFSHILPRISRELEMLFYRTNKQVSDELKSLVWDKIKENPNVYKSVLSVDYNVLYLTQDRSIFVELDVSIIIWHLATELCFYTDKGSNAEADKRHVIKEISEYIMYILAFCPYMFSMGSVKVNFQSSCRHVGDLLKHCRGSSMSRVFEELTSRLTDGRVYLKREPGHVESVKGYLLDTDLLACADLVARKLREKEEQKWELLTKFWVETLTHVAALCNGISHAQQLRKGGEFLTHIWFLIEHLDLKEKFQMPRAVPHLEEEETPAPRRAVPHLEEETQAEWTQDLHICAV
ncbi:uncharacterized protein LOC115964898 [Quercus lobata]|nr:uncharacterized protein LOC115964898 [Quercus lobata]